MPEFILGEAEKAADGFARLRPLITFIRLNVMSRRFFSFLTASFTCFLFPCSADLIAYCCGVDAHKRALASWNSASLADLISPDTSFIAANPVRQPGARKFFASPRSEER